MVTAHLLAAAGAAASAAATAAHSSDLTSRHLTSPIFVSRHLTSSHFDLHQILLQRRCRQHSGTVRGARLTSSQCQGAAGALRPLYVSHDLRAVVCCRALLGWRPGAGCSSSKASQPCCWASTGGELCALARQPILSRLLHRRALSKACPACWDAHPGVLIFLQLPPPYLTLLLSACSCCLPTTLQAPHAPFARQRAHALGGRASGAEECAGGRTPARR